MPRKLTSKQETENQLKDAEELRSSPRDTLDTRHIKHIEGQLKIKVIGEWHVQKTDQ